MCGFCVSILRKKASPAHVVYAGGTPWTRAKPPTCVRLLPSYDVRDPQLAPGLAHEKEAVLSAPEPSTGQGVAGAVLRLGGPPSPLQGPKTFGRVPAAGIVSQGTRASGIPRSRRPAHRRLGIIQRSEGATDPGADEAEAAACISTSAPERVGVHGPLPGYARRDRCHDPCRARGESQSHSQLRDLSGKELTRLTACTGRPHPDAPEAQEGAQEPPREAEGVEDREQRDGGKEKRSW